MKHYELLLLISGALPEADTETVKNEVSGAISAAGCSVTHAEVWGRKRLAYPINKERHGVYVLMEFDSSDTARVREIVRKIQLNTLIMRHILLTKKPVSQRELDMQEAAQKRAHARAAREQTAKVTQPKPAETSAGAAPKISLEDLDKKLDEILDQDIMK